MKNMRDMFSDCSALTTILSFAFRNYFASDAMFYECTSSQERRISTKNTQTPEWVTPKGGTLVDIRGIGSFLAH